MTTMTTDWWGLRTVVRDDTMMYARTSFADAWDGHFVAVCPHGALGVWISVPSRNPFPACACGGT
jgi:hypothetical protein